MKRVITIHYILARGVQLDESKYRKTEINIEIKKFTSMQQLTR
jgi:hypothetical protein